MATRRVKTSKSLSAIHSERMVGMAGELGTPTTHVHFRDGSQLDFEARLSNPNPRTVGDSNSFAHSFASDVKNFNIKSPRVTSSLRMAHN